MTSRTTAGPMPLAPVRARHRKPPPAIPRPLRAFWVRWGPLLVLALGIEMRLRQWLGARSLWLDEALIARSLVSRGYGRLVSEPLQGDQAGPVLWLWSTRLSLDLFGDGERQLRLVSLLSGIAVLLLTWRLARRLLPQVLAPVVLAVVVLSPSLLYFSNEVKPYSLDVAVVLALVLLALRVPPGSPPGRELGLLAVAAAVAVWASYAAVFTLTGLSVLLVLRAAQHSRGRAVRVALPLTGWVVSLGLAYVLVLHRLRDSEVLGTFWAFTFPQGPADLPAWLLRRTVDLIHDPLALAVWPVTVALLLLGCWRLTQRGIRVGLLAIAGVPVATAAAALSAYPLASRLALWIVPLAALVLAAALIWPAEGIPVLPLVAAVALLVVSAPLAGRVLPRAVTVQHVEELRPVMEAVARQRQPEDLVLVDIPAKAPFDFYTPLTGLGRDGVILFATPEEVGGQCNDDAALGAAKFASRRVWVVFAHPLADGARLGTRADTLSRIGTVTRVGQTIERDGARAVLFDPQASEPVATAPRNPKRCLAVVRTVPPTG